MPKRRPWRPWSRLQKKTNSPKPSGLANLCKIPWLWQRLFSEYKRDLLDEGSDDRLQASLAIEHGLKYFAGLMKAQKGDMSLALASYNAGPG